MTDCIKNTAAMLLLWQTKHKMHRIKKCHGRL